MISPYQLTNHPYLHLCQPAVLSELYSSLSIPFWQLLVDRLLISVLGLTLNIWARHWSVLLRGHVAFANSVGAAATTAPAALFFFGFPLRSSPHSTLYYPTFSLAVQLCC